jgi:hypothetical protein
MIVTRRGSAKGVSIKYHTHAAYTGVGVWWFLLIQSPRKFELRFSNVALVLKFRSIPSTSRQTVCSRPKTHILLTVQYS